MSDLAQAQLTNGQPTLSARADALEEHMMHELEHIVTKSVLFGMDDGKVEMDSGPALMAKNPGKYMLMGADPRLPKMPAKPTLLDYFRCRFASTSHLLQSATHALKVGEEYGVWGGFSEHDRTLLRELGWQDTLNGERMADVGKLDTRLARLRRQQKQVREERERERAELAGAGSGRQAS